MAKIIECVPNFSEGRDKDVIDAISQAIAETEGKCAIHLPCIVVTLPSK